MSRKNSLRLFGNRKYRKAKKMDTRARIAFWDTTGDPYKGEHRECLEMIAKSSSIETFIHAGVKIDRFRKDLDDARREEAK